jgi:hypothetical protein
MLIIMNDLKICHFRLILCNLVFHIYIFMSISKMFFAENLRKHQRTFMIRNNLKKEKKNTAVARSPVLHAQFIPKTISNLNQKQL